MNSIKIQEVPDKIDLVAVFREVDLACDRWLKRRGIFTDWRNQISGEHRVAAAAKGKK